LKQTKRYNLSNHTDGAFILANHLIDGQGDNSSTVGNDNLVLPTNAYNEVEWVQAPGRPNELWLYGSPTFNGSIDNVSVKKVIGSKVLGFNRVDSDKLQKAGVVTSINDNIITLENNAALPKQDDYCLFVKNQVVNMNGLSGYYADVMFENNSREKAELFSVSSEITESSK